MFKTSTQGDKPLRGMGKLLLGHLHPSHQPAMRGVMAILLILAAGQFLAWLIPAQPGAQGISFYLIWHTLMEFAAIVVAMMVFIVGWGAHWKRGNAGNLTLLACIYFAVGALDFCHTAAYVGMPDFFSPNDNADKHLYFWLSARFLAAIGLLVVSLRSWEESLREKSKYLILFLLIAAVLLINWIVIWHHEVLPPLFIPGHGLTPLKINLEYLFIAINGVTAAVLWVKMRRPQSFNAALLLGAVGAMAMSELFFTFYITMTGTYNVLGHIYKVVSYCFVYRALVASAIERPYIELAEAQQNLELAVSAANTGLWQWNVSSGQVYFSSSWKKQLGYGENELAETFSAWQELIHPDDRADIMAHIERFLHSPEKMDYEAEFRLRHHDRSYRWVLARGKKEINAQGKVTRIIGAQIDVTERRHAEDRFKSAVEASPNAMVMVDEQGLIALTNSQANVMFGYPPNALVGQPLDILIPTQARKAHARHVAGYMQHVAERNMSAGRELYALHKDGHDFRVEIRLIPITAETGHYVIASIVDLTAQIESEQKIHQLINFDPLTGLPNRSLLNDRVHQAISMANREGEKFALLFIDLDRFKNINDTLGHRIGDKLLVEVGERLKSCLRNIDTASRVGGDEFVLVCYGIQEGFIAQLASKLLAKISQPYLIDAHELIITPSIGVAIYPEDGKDFDTLFQHADTAMYQTKQDGRNDFRFFTPEMRLRTSRIMALENAMHHALDRDQFHLVYQPQLALDSGKVVGCEVLLRWTHPELGAISPAEFIPLAENNGRIVLIGAWVLHTGLQQLKTWMDAGLPEMSLAVNLSAAQFRHKGLPGLVAQLLAETKIPPHCLELELTESAAMDDPLGSIGVMNEFHQRGVLMSIDDFGTGYSSLSYLKKFNISKLKIDQSFVRDIVADADDRAIVTAIIQMAHSLGFKTIAEGVETEAQRDFLVQQGCNEAQGYLFARPLPADQFALYCQENLKKTAAN